MPTAMDRALTRYRANSNYARTTALSIKRSGGSLFDIAPSSGLAQLTTYQDQGANRQRYAQFHGWVHAAINAIAQEAANQPVHIGKLQGAKKKPKTSKASKVEHPYNRLAKGYEIRKMPKHLAEKAAKTGLEIIEDHPLLTSLQKPNTMQHSWQFVYSFVANICITGWGYIVADVRKDGTPVFFSIPTTWVTPVHTKGLFAEFKIQNPNDPSTNNELIPASNVGFAYIPNPSDPLSAYPPVGAQSRAIKIDDNIQSSQVQFFGNAIFPSAIVTMGSSPHPDVPGGIRPRLTPAQRRQVYAAIKKVMSGVANYGNPAIIDGMIEKIERLSATHNEIGWEKSEKAVRTRILSAFGVHPFILGEEMAGSYAQAYIVQDRFCKRVNVFLGMLSLLMTGLAPQFVKDDDKLQVWYEEAEAKDPSMEKSLWEGARTRQDVTQDEFRTFMGLPPDEDRNEQQIDKTSVQAVAGIAAQVKVGTLARDQAIGILVGMGISDDLADDIAGEEPDPAELAAAQGGMPPDQGGFGGGDQGGSGGKQPPADDTGFNDATGAMEESLKSIATIDRLIKLSKMSVGEVKLIEG